MNYILQHETHETLIFIELDDGHIFSEPPLFNKMKTRVSCRCSPKNQSIDSRPAGMISKRTQPWGKPSSPARGPPNGSLTMENIMKIDDLGIPPLMETPIFLLFQTW